MRSRLGRRQCLQRAQQPTRLPRESLHVLLQRQGLVLAPAPAVLGSRQSCDHLWLARQLGEPRGIFFHPHLLAGPQAQLQLRMDQLDQQCPALGPIAIEVILNPWPLPRARRPRSERGPGPDSPTPRWAIRRLAIRLGTAESGWTWSPPGPGASAGACRGAAREDPAGWNASSMPLAVDLRKHLAFSRSRTRLACALAWRAPAREPRAVTNRPFGSPASPSFRSGRL